jgi:hypothetical protein
MVLTINSDCDSINRLGFIAETYCVACEVQNEFLCNVLRHSDPTSRQRGRHTVTNIWSWEPEGAGHEDILTDRPSVVTWLWLWLQAPKFFLLHSMYDLVDPTIVFMFLVVRVLGYRSGGPGSIPGTTKKSSGYGTGSTQPREYNWGSPW